MNKFKLPHNTNWINFQYIEFPKSDVIIPSMNTELPCGIPSFYDIDDLCIEEFNFTEFLKSNTSDEIYSGKVRGESMLDMHIIPGDWVVIDKKAEPQNGDMVVAEVDGELTVKNFRTVKNYDSVTIYLEPANPEYQTIQIYEHNNLIIWGVVKKVLRDVKRNNYRSINI